MEAKVLTVDSVVAHVTAGAQAGLHVTAMGRVPTSGWTSPKLIPRIYFVPPADGIWDMDMVASSPSGIALQVVLPVGPAVAFVARPSWCKGIRIHAAENSVESPLIEEPVGLVNVDSESQPLNWVPYPWSSKVAAQAEGGGDSWPWHVTSKLKQPVFPSALDEDKHSTADTIASLVGCSFRKIYDGDMVTLDWRPSRFNIVLSRDGAQIIQVHFG